MLVLSPWNYPYLTAVNAVVPALLSGNTVVLKHSDQTPMAAEHFKRAFEAAGLDRGVFQVLHMNHEATAQVLVDDCIDHVAFTGSVEGWRRRHFRNVSADGTQALHRSRAGAGRK